MLLEFYMKPLKLPLFNPYVIFLMSFLKFFSYLSMSMICIQFAEHFLVESWTTCFCDSDSELVTDVVDALPGSVKCWLTLADALDTDRSLHILALSDVPFDDTEVNRVLLACVDALIESLRIKQMSNQADCKALYVGAFTCSIRSSICCFIRFSQLRDILVVGSEFSMGSDDGAIDL